MKPESSRIGAPSWLQILAVVAAALVAVATSRLPYETVPGWLITEHRDLQIEELHAKVWISKSGPGGVGITLRLDNPAETPKTVKIKKGEFVIGASVSWADALPQVVAVGGGETRYIYVPFFMDNRRNWEDRNIKGVLKFVFSTADGGEIEWILPVEYVERRYRYDDGVSDLDNDGIVGVGKTNRDRVDEEEQTAKEVPDAGAPPDNPADPTTR